MTDRDKLIEELNKQAQIKTLTFLQTYTTLAEAEAWQSKIPAPTIILHLWSRGGKDLFAVAGNDDVQMLVSALKPAESKPLPESVEEWLAHNHRFERDAAITKYIKVFDYAIVEYYLQQREAVYQAELAKAKSEGRREATEEIVAGLLKMGKGADENT